MKKVVLCICLLPVISFAKQTPDHFLKVFNQGTQAVSTLRTAAATLDSTYVYQGEEEMLTDIHSYTYDESGRKVKEETKSVNSFNGNQSLSSRTEYIYPETPGNGSYETEERVYSYHEGEWLPVLKTFNEYNASAVQTAMRSYRYENGEWVKDWVWDTVEYTDKGYPKVAMDSTFHTDGSLEVYKMDAVFGDNGLVASGINSEWNEESKAWVPNQNAKLTYDEQGNVISQYTEFLEDGKWIFGFEYTYQYDAHGNMTLEEDKENDGTVFYMRYRNFYSDNTTTHNESIQAGRDFNIAVNASSRMLEFDLGDVTEGQIRLINASGVVVRQETVRNSQHAIPLNSLSSGFYIVHMNTPQGEQSRRVIIR
ncbi:T9SS type A sorting domain-containing protein [Parabacteroides sp.]